MCDGSVQEMRSGGGAAAGERSVRVGMFAPSNPPYAQSCLRREALNLEEFFFFTPLEKKKQNKKT